MNALDDEGARLLSGSIIVEKDGLRIGVFGATGDITFNVQNELMGDGKSLIGVIEGDAVPKLFLPELLAYYKKGMFPFDRLIEFYPFEQINEAQAASDAGKCIKAVLRME